MFSGGIGSKNYAGFDRNKWESRNNTDHHSCITMINQSQNKTERNKLESQFGCRYSVLLDLPYFDAVRMTIVDPMHNLFLGTAKRMIKIWIQQDILTRSAMTTMQGTIDSMTVPTEVGRIPGKVEFGFDHFTADQFKNWVIFYSIPCLYGILSTDKLESWRHFVLACRILCQHSLTLEQIALADAHLLKFCNQTEHLYGQPVITPNMHMHCHLRNCLLDYGPVYSFWCFSYERYNGILGNQPSNNRDIEPQLMMRFLADNAAYSLQCPAHYQKDFDLVSLSSPTLVGSLLQTATLEKTRKIVTLSKTYTRILLDSHDKILIMNILAKLENCQGIHIDINSIARKYTSVTVNDTRFSCHKNQLCIMLQWDENLLGVSRCSYPIRPAKIIKFLQVSYKCCKSSSSHDFCTIVLAHVSWYLSHPSYSQMGKPVQIWCYGIFEMSGFVPMSLYNSQCVHCIHLHQNERVLLVVPL